MASLTTILNLASTSESGGTWSDTVGANSTATFGVADSDTVSGHTSANVGQFSITGRSKSNTNTWTWTGTWENLGVTAGSTITNVQVIRDWRCSTYTTGAASSVGIATMTDSGGANSINLDGSTTAYSATGSWATKTGTASVAVPSAYQASSSTIKLNLPNTMATGSSNSAVNTLHQTYVQVVITYTPPSITKTQTATARIQNTVTQTQNAVANIALTTPKEAYVQEVGHATGTAAGTTLAISVTNAPTAGNTLILSFMCSDQQITSVADSKGNTWTVQGTSAHNTHLAVATCKQDVGALTTSDTITVTLPSSTGEIASTVHEFSGLLDLVDNTSNATASTTTNRDAGTLVTYNEDSLIWTVYGVLGTETSFTHGTGFTTPTTAFYNTPGASPNAIEVQYRIGASSSTYVTKATGGVAALQDGLAVAFKADNGGPKVVGNNTFVATTTVTSGTVALPTGWQAGDVFYLFAANSAASGTITAPTGYSTIIASFNSALGSSFTSSQAACFRKILTSTESDPSITCTSGRLSAVGVLVRGADSTTPEDVSASDDNTGVTNPGVQAPSVTPTQTTDLILMGNALRNGTNGGITAFTPPPNANKIAEAIDVVVSVSNSAIEVNQAISYGTWATGVFRATTTASTFNPMGMTVAVKAPPASSTKTQTATARIQTTPIKTQTAIARIQVTGLTKTQTATARIAHSETATQTAIARILNTGMTKTQTAIARISVVGLTKTQTAIARIAKSFTKTQTAIARIQTTGNTKTQTSVARIQKTGLTKTQTSVARVQVTGLTKTQTAVARIGLLGTKNQTAVARISNTGMTHTQPATARILNPNMTHTQAATARVSVVGLIKTQTSIARIQKTGQTKTQTAVARIAHGETKTQTAIARIQITGIKTQPAVARVLNTGMTKTQTATAHIIVAGQSTKSQTATARIQVIGLTKTQSAIARIAKSFTKTQTSTARVQTTGNTKTQTAVARILKTALTKTQTAVARVAKSFTKTQPATARIKVIGLTKTQTSVSRVQVIGLTKTQPATAHIITSFVGTKTQTSVARILVQNLISTQTAIARIQTTPIATQMAVARILTTPIATQTAIARIIGQQKTFIDAPEGAQVHSGSCTDELFIRYVDKPIGSPRGDAWITPVPYL